MKSFLIYANCQAVALGSMLQLIESFNQTYKFVRIRPVHRISEPEITQLKGEVFPSLGAFLHQPVRDGFRGEAFGSERLRSYVPDGVPKFAFPSLQFYGYQPSGFVFRTLTLPQREAHMRIFTAASGDTFHFTQVVRAFLKGRSQVEALKRFHDGYAGDGAFAVKFARRSLEKVISAEGQHALDITAAQYIGDNYQSEALFNTPRHPRNPVLMHVIDQLARLLDLTITADDMERLKRRDPLVLPAYPLQHYVREALGMTFEPKQRFIMKKTSMDEQEMIAAFYAFYATMPAEQLDRELTLQAQSAAAV